jgi:ATP-dependent helicase/nuclease subunit B
MNLFAIPPNIPFLEALANGWLAVHRDDAADGLLLLPTRRSARALAEAFLRANHGAPLLLPRIVALGAVDETPLAINGALDHPPAIDEARRRALLSSLILGMNGTNGAPRTVDRAWLLAAELATLIDESERAEIDLRTALPKAADHAHAEHWQVTVDFLSIVTEHWPRMLAEQGLANPVGRQVALLDAQAAVWSATPPRGAVWAAGMSAAIPAVGRLLRVIAGLPRGRVVLPGLDHGLADDVWDALPDTHPQSGLSRLIASIGATRRDVIPWPAVHSDVPPARPDCVNAALLPAGALDAWRRIEPDPGGLTRLGAAHEQEDAAAIALVLRGALEKPGATAALVTPDRALATRVAAELTRFGIVADDSAGEPLAETPPGAFLRLVAHAIADDLAPVPLLALLKHPLAGAGLSPGACRAAARMLELECLRGPRPGPGLAGLRRAADDSRSDGVRQFVARLEQALEPAFRSSSAAAQSPGWRMAGLIDTAERLAATDTESGPARLWSGEEGEALAETLTALTSALAVLEPHDMSADTLPGLLDAMLDGAVVRSRRALRGRDAQSEHPRVFIWGTLEARLLSADMIVLGGLAETVWPPATDPGPWLSRPMRTAIGLPSPEERIGQSAHDFVMACCAAPTVVLSCPTRRDRAPAVPSRFLMRLETMLRGCQRELSRHPAADWARLLDEPTKTQSESPPEPRPPVAKRPRRLSVTEIETWRRDPYAIYAKHILRLRRLEDLNAQTEAADFGTIVHRVLGDFVGRHGVAWPDDAADVLAMSFATMARKTNVRDALLAWWVPRLRRMAGWIDEVERLRRAAPLEAIHAEIAGDHTLDGPAGPFVLHGRADRIETRADGRLSILDYKTGSVPSRPQIETGFAPQMPLEAAMAQEGAFKDVRGRVVELLFVKLTGGFDEGEMIDRLKGDEAAIAAIAAEALKGLRDLVAAFDHPDMAYRSRPWRSEAPRYADYEQLARVAEWAAATA